jgi:hypothetical protein
VNIFTGSMLLSGAITTRGNLTDDALYTLVEACVAAEAILVAEPDNEGVASLLSLLRGNLDMMDLNMMLGAEHACR